MKDHLSKTRRPVTENGPNVSSFLVVAPQEKNVDLLSCTPPAKTSLGEVKGSTARLFVAVERERKLSTRLSLDKVPDTSKPIDI
jgi:hypothetical protein